jgi:hypothetical protein
VAIEVFRCTHCGREVLVRHDAPLSEAEIARRMQEEFEPAKPGPSGRPDFGSRLRDDIWVGVSGTREPVPRDELPERCPACRRTDWLSMRVLD